LCDKAESFHREDSERKHLDTEEAHMLNQWGTSLQDDMTARQSSFVNIRKSMKQMSQDLEASASQIKRQPTIRDNIACEPCSICYYNEIQAGTAPVTDDLTVEFDCKHRFCLDCSKEMLRSHIKANSLDKLLCL